MADERWLPVPTWEGFYEVSDLGRVRSVARAFTNSRGARRSYPGKIIAQRRASNGYWRVTLSDEHAGRRQTEAVHRLVALAFLPNPNGRSQVNHLNGFKDENMVRNLAWASPRENRAHARENGLTARGEANGASVLSDAKVQSIRLLYATDEFTQDKLASMFGVSRQTIGKIIRGEGWKHV